MTGPERVDIVVLVGLTHHLVVRRVLPFQAAWGRPDTLVCHCDAHTDNLACSLLLVYQRQSFMGLLILWGLPSLAHHRLVEVERAHRRKVLTPNARQRLNFCAQEFGSLPVFSFG